MSESIEKALWTIALELQAQTKELIEIKDQLGNITDELREMKHR